MTVCALPVSSPGTPGEGEIHAAEVPSRRVRLGGRVVTPRGVLENASAKADPTEYGNGHTTSVLTI